MERGRLLVAPRASGGRRHKALAPWRFQHGFVRREGKAAAAAAVVFEGVECVFSARSCSLDASGSGGESKEAGRNCESGRSGCNGSVGGANVEGLDRGGCCRVGNDGKSERFGSNGGVEGCGLKGFESGGTTAGEDCESETCATNGTARGCDVGGFESSSEGGDEKGCDSERLGSNGGVENCKPGGSKRCCAVNGGLESNVSAAGEHRSEGLERGGEADGNLRSNEAEGLKGGGAAKVCNLDGLESNGDTRETNGSAEYCNLQGSKGIGPTKENGAAANDCDLVGFGCHGSATGCRRGRKALAPWRFQTGYKRSFSKAFSFDNGSSGCLGTPESRVRDCTRQCTPATGSTVWLDASSHYFVTTSSACDFSSVKGDKETSAALKKRKFDIDNNDHQAIQNNEVVLTRESIMGALQEFQIIYRKLVEEEESKWRETGHKPRSDLVAFKIFRERFYGEYNDRSYVGSVPGIQIGDVFRLRVELCIVGLHRPHRVGIDYIKTEDGACVAVSVVSYAHCSDIKNNLDVFIYTGSLAATCDQRIDGTNLALKRSMDTNTPVRVIHGLVTHLGENCRPKKLTTYVYGGLYLVEKYWREKESENRFVYMFRLRRKAGQKHIDIQEILKSRKPDPYYGILMEDISQGLERVPISVVNSVSKEYPLPFHYSSRLQYPPKYQPAPPAGCDCVGGCSDSKKCACAVKNGGEIPFNDKGAIIEAKPLVYECGPSCRCPPTCHNRVGQHGIKFRLQVFKTKSMGWGVRSLDFIPSGSFVCEYIGELLEDEEAQKRATDEYLFAIGNNYYDETLWEGLSRSIPSLQKGPSEDDEVGLSVDASIMGNFARFINHSCTPNLYAQNVLYDHDNKSMPHIMFFACEDIPPLQELAYHYNYTIDQVHDFNGNIKKKKCLCGSIECTGWLY